MMFDHGSSIIVLLDPANKGTPLWLEKKEKLQFDDFSIIKETENAQEELQITLNHTKNEETISLNVFTAQDWTTSIPPPSPEYMLDLLKRVQNCWEMQKCPITVVCSDGCSKSGLFVALKLVLEKLQIDEEIDIFQVVRKIQTRRPEFLMELDQYEYCYKCIRVLLEGDSRDSLYANVQKKSKISATTVHAHNKYRPYLMSYGKTRSDYINAVIIPGYSDDGKISKIIVLLDPGNKNAPLWLKKKEMLQFDDFRIVKEPENAQGEFPLTLNHTVGRSLRFNMNTTAKKVTSRK
ncbi:PTPRC [Mytilus coruscus]|uniref:PTPRC n=1 Tax=Mytilus coruscus TaxID=42192 RepID=A0A6J8B9T1_MYTCO|nr:PTPRC [Mytilus coruscus]